MISQRSTVARAGRFVAVLVAFWALQQVPVARAETSPRTREEISFLLSYLQSSGCTFDRNGSQYDSAKAADHLRYKYRALDSRGDIGSAEEFVDKAASVSSITGRAYTVACGSDPARPTGEWLRALLLGHRAAFAPH